MLTIRRNILWIVSIQYGTFKFMFRQIWVRIFFKHIMYHVMFFQNLPISSTLTTASVALNHISRLREERKDILSTLKYQPIMLDYYFYKVKQGSDIQNVLTIVMYKYGRIAAMTCIPSFLILLTHWGRVTHICVSKQTIIGSDNGLSPGRRQAIFWTNAGILLIGPLGTNFSENLIEILTFSFTKMRLKVSSAKWRPFCPGLNVLSQR